MSRPEKLTRVKKEEVEDESWKLTQSGFLELE
jgi:hypothetical protein